MLFQSQYFHFYSHIPCGMWRIRLYLHLCCRLDFYSHIPCGMWRTSSGATNGNFLFLLTHPVWDVTLRESVTMFFIAFLLTHPVWDVTPFLGLCDVLKLISTHTSRVGCDFCQSCWFISKSDFYSHIPCGMWQSPLNLLPPSHDFYSHIPCGMWLTSKKKYS